MTVAPGDKGDVSLAEVPVSHVTPVRARPEGIANAEPLMAKAALDEGGKRDPITLIRDGDDSYRVYDGNSTFAIAVKNDWKSVLAMIVDSEEEAAELELKAKSGEAYEKSLDVGSGDPAADLRLVESLVEDRGLVVSA